LVSIFALPAIWTGSEPSQIASTLLTTLLGMLDLDLVYIRLRDADRESPIEIVRTASDWGSRQLQPRDVGAMLEQWPVNDTQWSPVRCSFGDRDVSIVSLRLGLQDEIGLLAVGSRRPDFPQQAERLILSVAANHAYIGIQEARLLSEQIRLTSELDRRVAQRTAELAKANEELRKEIAERRRIEEQLRHSKAFLAEGQHLARIGNFSWVVTTDEIRWSEQLYRIFEFKKDTTVTLERIASRVHPEDSAMLYDMIERARAGVDDFEYEHRLLMPDQSVKYLHLIAHGSQDSQGRFEYIGAVQDVTQRRSSEDALARAKSELAHVARINSLAMLTASIAHEVNQPLSGIITNASTSLRMLGADPPNIDGARETARRTIRDGNRAAEVVTRLRTLFTNREIAAESLSLNDVTKEVIALSLSDLQRNRTLLRIELADDLPKVTGDRVQLQQVIFNLVRNASEAMSNVDDRPREMLIRTQCIDENQVHLIVKDVGVGFTPQVADRLFEAFYTTKSDGMGIGLSISRSIIEAHHGRMWATPNDGPGATFSVSIPRESA
jgi:C4-dicarboxylate-specific signal transduction histidine kinase